MYIWPPKGLEAFLSVVGPRLFTPHVSINLRGVDDESIPLALDVVVRRLFGDIKTVKFNLSGDLLLPLKDHHGNLEVELSHECTRHHHV